MTHSPDYLLTMSQVLKILPLSKTTVYRMIKRKDFPKPIKLGKRRIAFFEHDIMSWMENLPQGLNGVSDDH